MKIYTGTGDRGKTSLFSGERVSKDHRRIEAYGDVDELNSILGLVAADLQALDADLRAEILRIQSDLFHIGAWLATTPGASSSRMLAVLGEESVHRLENAIDRMEADLQPLQHFILPGGHRISALTHIARTVCRRAERRVIGLIEESTAEPLPDPYHWLRVYLNRLSDYLFVLARKINQVAGVEEIQWKQP